MRKWKELAIGMLTVMLAGVSAVPQSVCAADTGERTQILSAGIGTKLLQKGNSKGIALTQEVFKDENVLKAVKEYDIDGDGYLSETEELAVTYIDIYSEGVEDTSGLEKLTHVKSVYLNCACTSIKLGKSVQSLNISISENMPAVRISGQGLRNIEVSARYHNNELASCETVDVSPCSQLEYFKSSVGLSALKLPKNSSKLVEMEITRSALKTLNLKSASNLKRLTVAGNSQLKKINLSKNTKLEELDCSGNRELTKLDCSKNTKLTALYCYSNKLTSLKVAKAVALESVDCSDNELSSLNFSKNKALKTLNCADNKLTSLDLSKNSALTRVDCYENPLQELYIKDKTNAFKEISVVPEIVSVESKKPGTISVELKSQNNGHQYLIDADGWYFKVLSDKQPSGVMIVASYGTSYKVKVLGGKKYNEVNVYTDIVTYSSSVFVESKK